MPIRGGFAEPAPVSIKNIGYVYIGYYSMQGSDNRSPSLPRVNDIMNINKDTMFYSYKDMLGIRRHYDNIMDDKERLPRKYGEPCKNGSFRKHKDGFQKYLNNEYGLECGIAYYNFVHGKKIFRSRKVRILSYHYQDDMLFALVQLFD